MAHAHHHPVTRLRTALIAIAAWLIVSALPLPAAAQPPPGAPLVDLAALMPVPAELAAEGMAGFRLGWSWTYMTIEEAVTADRYAESRAGFRPRSVTGAESVLREAGWQRFHETALSQPRADEPDLVDFSVVTSIEEYATAEGAARAFAAFTTIDALNEGIAGVIELQPEPAPLGDQSVTWRVAGTAQDDPDVATLALVRMVRVDTRIVSMTLFDIFDPAPTMDPAPLERLTSQLVQRVERAVALGQHCPTSGPTSIRAMGDDRAAARAGLYLPGLSVCVQRLFDTGAIPGRAYYIALDGTAIERMEQTSEELAAFQADIDAFGLRDAYLLTYAIDRADKRAYYSIFIDRYRDEETATVAFAGLEARRRANAEFPVASFEPGVPAIGDASATYVVTDAATGFLTTTSATRIDDIVVTLRIFETTEPLPATTQSLLLSQIACMEAGGCSQPIPVPPEIVPAQPMS